MEQCFRTAKDKSTIFHNLSNVCKSKASGLFSPVENPVLNHEIQFDRYEDEAISCCDDGRDSKIHPHPTEYAHLAGSEHSVEAIVAKVFNSISSLKSAYVQLQQAHIPYDRQSIQAADELVESEFHLISELESSYVQIRRSRAQALLSLHGDLEEQQALELRQRNALMSKDSEILHLRSKIKLVKQRTEELEGLVNKVQLPELELFQTSHEWTPQLFSKVFKLASKSIHDFTKLLINLMKESDWDLDLAASAICNSIPYAERSHKKFAFEAFLSNSMLRCSHDEYFNPHHFEQVMHFDDPFDSLVQDPDSDFGRFCRSKYLAAVPLKMEASFFGNLDQRSFVLGGRHPRTQFYGAFVGMARRVWALQVIADSFIPRAEIFYCKRGTKFSKQYMESVVYTTQLVVPAEVLRPEVGFTVMPGFCIGRDINRCKVYVIYAK